VSTLADQIRNIIDIFTSREPSVSARFLQRLNEGCLTRDEGNMSHFCVYFLPYDPASRKVFMIHHKKSGKWLSPGGHIDRGELLLEALNREIQEELGVTNAFPALPAPFLITATPIDNPIQPCKEHLDLWFLLETNGSSFAPDPHEFLATRWLDFDEAESLITDPANRKALGIVRSRNAMQA